MSSRIDGDPKRRVWLYIADGASPDDLRDLDHLDSLIWGANEHTRKGDIVLMYRGAPYRDIVYSFEALSDPEPADRRSQSYLPHIITLGKKRRVPKPVTLDHLRADPILRRWSISRSPQGVMQRRRDLIAEGVWPRLRQLLQYKEERASRQATKGAGNKIFLSYAREDEPRVKRLAKKLAAVGLNNAWLDRTHIKPGDEWRAEIYRALSASGAVIVCLSPATEVKAKTQFFNTEVGWAIKLAGNPRSRSVIIPVKLTECKVPSRLQRWHYAELFKPGGLESLIERLKYQLRQPRARKPA